MMSMARPAAGWSSIVRENFVEAGDLLGNVTGTLKPTLWIEIVLVYEFGEIVVDGRGCLIVHVLCYVEAVLREVIGVFGVTGIGVFHFRPKAGGRGEFRAVVFMWVRLNISQDLFIREDNSQGDGSELEESYELHDRQ